MNLKEILETEIENLGSQEDTARGFKDVSVECRDGTAHVVRVSTPPVRFRQRLMGAYAASEDPRDMVRAVVDHQFASDAFLDSLTPESLATLANTAAALLMGFEFLKVILRESLKKQGVL